MTSQVNVVRPGGRPRIRTGTTTSASCPTRSRRATRRTCTCCRRCSRCRAPSPTPTCRWRADRRCTSPIPTSTPPVTWPGAGRSSASSSPAATSNCRWPRATRCSSIRRCSTGRGPIRPPTCSGWPTCCRCPRRSAGRWRPSTGSRWPRRSIPCCRPAGPRASTGNRFANAINCAAEGYPFPTNLDRDEKSAA